MKKFEIEVCTVIPEATIIKTLVDDDAVWAAKGLLSNPVYNENDILEVRYKGKALYKVYKKDGKVEAEKTKYYKTWLSHR